MTLPAKQAWLVQAILVACAVVWGVRGTRGEERGGGQDAVSFFISDDTQEVVLSERAAPGLLLVQESPEPPRPPQPPDVTEPPELTAPPEPPRPVRREAAPRRTVEDIFGTRSLARSRARPGFARLSRVPPMLGDSLSSVGQLSATFNTEALKFAPQTGAVLLDIPLPAAATGVKIAANSSAVPADRVFFTYSHFDEAFVAQQTAPAADVVRREFNAERAVFGLEKTLSDGLWSIDLRVPLLGSYDFTTPTFSSTAGGVGNVAMHVKRLLYAGDTLAVSGGMGVNAALSTESAALAPLSELTLENRALYVLPFLAATAAPSESCFLQGFLQFNLPTKGNRIRLRDRPGLLMNVGDYDDQSLVFLDLAAGHWLFRDPDGGRFTGLAALVELHYTGTLNDSDHLLVAGATDTYELVNPANRLDIVNLTAGLHAQFAQTNVRVAVVAPLRDGNERRFNAEVIVQANRNF